MSHTEYLSDVQHDQIEKALNSTGNGDTAAASKTMHKEVDAFLMSTKGAGVTRADALKDVYYNLENDDSANKFLPALAIREAQRELSEQGRHGDDSYKIDDLEQLSKSENIFVRDGANRLIENLRLEKGNGHSFTNAHLEQAIIDSKPEENRYQNKPKEQVAQEKQTIMTQLENPGFALLLDKGAPEDVLNNRHNFADGLVSKEDLKAYLARVELIRSGVESKYGSNEVNLYLASERVKVVENLLKGWDKNEYGLVNDEGFIKVKKLNATQGKDLENWLKATA
jgi:hypothetical protein